MRIVVTGGRGRVGRAVVELAAAQGHEVTVVDRADARPWPEAESGEGVFAKVKSVNADVMSYDDLERVLDGCDGLVHLAAYPSPHGRPEYETHNNNVVGSYNALQAAVACGVTRVCQASSVNATGASFSRRPRYDYFPLDEGHPTYNEDAYSLSKWICEAQGDSVARRHENMTIASLRFHAVVPSRERVLVTSLEDAERRRLDLWGYTALEAAARACLLSLTADFTGHEAFYIIAPRTAADVPSLDLARHYYPEVPVTGDLSGNASFFSSAKAERILGWRHDDGSA